MRVGLTTNPRVLRLAECLLESAEYLEWSVLSYGVHGYPPPSATEIKAERHAALRVTRYVTVTALLKFWGYANEHIRDDYIAGIVPEDVDEITGVPGFAEALRAAGWAEFGDVSGLTLPNFSEHNTSADKRSSGADRQKRYRDRIKTDGDEKPQKRNVTRNVTVTPREEKRREEKKDKEKLDLPEWLDGHAWSEFASHRAEIGKPMTDKAAIRMVAKLARLRDDGVDVKAAMDDSIRNGWQDVFAAKGGKGATRPDFMDGAI